ncbi:hypothetical protein, partial [Bacteroides acidifaciens]|uniref:hypothetical protein n=1 Tax=Bacteroides acidifaciens TaxID=85831 RepID=UPI0025A6474A
MSTETVNNDTSLATSAFVHKCVDDIDLTDYALKSEIPNIDVNNVRAYDDLSYCSTDKTSLTIGVTGTLKLPSILPFAEGAHIVVDAVFDDGTEHLDFIFKTNSTTSDTHTMIYNVNGTEAVLRSQDYTINWNISTGEFTIKGFVKHKGKNPLEYRN